MIWLSARCPIERLDYEKIFFYTKQNIWLPLTSHLFLEGPNLF